MVGLAAALLTAVASPSLAASSTVANQPTVTAGGRPGGADCMPTRPVRDAPTLDGFALRWIPKGAGPLVTDFEYEWEEVRFASRVFETGSEETGYRVDLSVSVLRSAAFTDLASVRGFLIDYLERDGSAWATRAFAHPDGPGYLEDRESFWLVEPGVAVRVSGGTGTLDPRDLRRTACAVRSLTSAGAAGR